MDILAFLVNLSKRERINSITFRRTTFQRPNNSYSQKMIYPGKQIKQWSLTSRESYMERNVIKIYQLYYHNVLKFAKSERPSPRKISF